MVGRMVQAVAGGVTAFYDNRHARSPSRRWTAATAPNLDPSLIPGYDLYLSFSGGPVLGHLEDDRGAPAARPLHCAVDPDLYHPVTVADPLGPRLSRHLQRRPPADRRPAADRGGAPAAGPPVRRRRTAVSGDDRLAGECRSSGPCRPPADHPAFYGRHALHPERHPRRHGPHRPFAQRAAVRGGGLRQRRSCPNRWDGLDETLAVGREILVADDADAGRGHS